MQKQAKEESWPFIWHESYNPSLFPSPPTWFCCSKAASGLRAEFYIKQLKWWVSSMKYGRVDLRAIPFDEETGNSINHQRQSGKIVVYAMAKGWYIELSGSVWITARGCVFVLQNYSVTEQEGWMVHVFLAESATKRLLPVTLGF